MCKEKDVQKLKEVLGENLVALAEYNNGDEIRCLAVCKTLDFKILSELKKLLSDSVPVLFTQEEIKNAIDVFPVEFLNIKRHHKMLIGEDILKDIEIPKENLRQQLEFEFRSKLIHLRRAYILSNGNDIDNIILNAVPNIAPIIGAVMYLKDIDVKFDPDVIKLMIGIDTKVIMDIHRIKTGKGRFDEDKEKYIERLINVLTQIGDLLDKMKVKEEG